MENIYVGAKYCSYRFRKSEEIDFFEEILHNIYPERAKKIRLDARRAAVDNGKIALSIINVEIPEILAPKGRSFDC